MKKTIMLFVALLFALFAVGFVIPRFLNGKYPFGPEKETESSSVPQKIPVETMVPTESGREPSESETEETSPEYGPGMEGDPGMEEDPDREPEEPEYEEEDPGPPVDREKEPANLIIASDIHYLSPSLTDYGPAFDKLIDNDDGKVIRYVPQIWEAFAEEVLARHPDALILSGDLTVNGEKTSHEALAARLRAIEDADIPVLVIPGNHDINNPSAASFFGEERSAAETITAEEFKTIYGKFGYEQAADHAPDSLSYLYKLNNTTWLLMLDTCSYSPVNEVEGRITPATIDWMRQILKDAYKEGITVLPVGHHNLQHLSRIFIEECVIHNSGQTLRLLENYLVPAYFGGHMHLQRIFKHTLGPGASEETYGLWEFVTNSLTIPPFQYGGLTLNQDGSFTYHTSNVDVAAWAARRGEKNPDLLDFSAFCDEYIRSVIGRQTHRVIEDIPDDIREELVAYYVDLYQRYYSGIPTDYQEEKKKRGYQLWERFMNPSVQFRQIDGMAKDGMAVNNNIEIPNPIHLNRE